MREEDQGYYVCSALSAAGKKLYSNIQKYEAIFLIGNFACTFSNPFIFAIQLRRLRYVKI